MRKLEGKVAVICGAGCGFGMSRGFPEIFAKNGANLVLNYNHSPSEKMKEFKNELEKNNIECILIQGDISDPSTSDRIVESAMEAFGRIDVLINNAGISEPALLTEISYEKWLKTINVNLNSVFLTCKAVLPIMIKQNFGRIINISSQIGQKGSVEHCHYCAAKAGMIGFTKALAREVGDKGITVNCIAPGPIKTQLSKNTSEEWLSNKAKELVIPRFGEIEEVLPSAIFLASEPDGNLFTGQTLGPNCGDVML